MEGILANQLDSYQEEHGLVHKRAYGFRKGRGTNTAMLEVWEFVLRRTEKTLQREAGPPANLTCLHQLKRSGVKTHLYAN